MNTNDDQVRTALILGASRGLGLALAEELWTRGWHVVATRRGPAPELDQLAQRSDGGVTIETIDIADPADGDRLAVSLEGRRFDLLMVNAGISIAKEDTPLSGADEDFLSMMVVNALSPVRMVERLEHLVKPEGALAFMSSELASIADNPGVCDLYSASKAALNMLVKCFAVRRADDPRAVLLIAPGWVRTGTGGEEALLSVEESIPFVATAIEANLGQAGLRFIDRFNQPINW